jgi:hypothetical protein
LYRIVNQDDHGRLVAIAGLKLNSMNRLNITAFPDVHVDVDVARKLLQFGNQILNLHSFLPGGGYEMGK